jgi:hypothetical protein
MHAPRLSEIGKISKFEILQQSWHFQAPAQNKKNTVIKKFLEHIKYTAFKENLGIMDDLTRAIREAEKFLTQAETEEIREILRRKYYELLKRKYEGESREPEEPKNPKNPKDLSDPKELRESKETKETRIYR